MRPAPSPVRSATAPDGTPCLLVALPPEALPSVLRRDLQAAWSLAHAAARRADHRAAPPRLLRFHREDGGTTTLHLRDRDARCWAAACERVAAAGSCYGVSLLLRLLALVELLGRARWAHGLLRLRHGEAELSPALLAAAAAAPLTAAGGLDEAALRARLPRPLPA